MEVRRLPFQAYPTTYELYDKYNEYRTKYFNDIVPPAHQITIEWNSSLTSAAGKCHYKYRLDKNGTFLTKKGKSAVAYDQIIKLSTQYHEIFPQDTYKTLLHEMIHLLIGGHGPNFAYWITRIRGKGGDVARYCNNWKHLKEPKWVYTCENYPHSCNNRQEVATRVRGGGLNRRFTCKSCGGRSYESKITEKNVEKPY